MNGAAVFHRASDSLCYSPDGMGLTLRLQCAAGDLSAVELWAGDPHDWAKASASGWSWRCAPHAARKLGTDGLRDFWEANWTPPYRRARYFFRLRASDGGIWDYGEKGLLQSDASPDGAPPAAPAGDFWNSFVFPYINAADQYRAPAWVAETVWYQVFPERFRNGDTSNDPKGVQAWRRGPVTNQEFFGGDLRGIIEGLDHIASLGCNGLYLTPIFASPSVHKYDTDDYLRIDPSFGTDDELRELVRACHARGMRIMLDAVFNHSGKGFGPWKDVLARGEASPYRDWFHIKAFPLFPKGKDSGDTRDANFEGFAFTTRMPKLNTANSELKEYLFGVAERYLIDFGIDGWRLDVSNEIDHAFWREFRARVKAVKPEAYIVGEIWHDAMPWLRGDQYDAVMNYPYGTAIADFLLAKHWSTGGKELAWRLAAISFAYPRPVLRSAFNLLDSHDTDRLRTRLGGPARARQALALLMSLPGAPCIYYGTEYALEGGHDPDCRRCMPWDPSPEELAFADFVRALVRMRRERWRLFSDGERISAYMDDKPGFAALGARLGAEAVVVMVNRGGEALSPSAWRGALGLASGEAALDLINGGQFERELLPDETVALALE
jgi:glycosidase